MGEGGGRTQCVQLMTLHLCCACCVLRCTRHKQTCSLQARAKESTCNTRPPPRRLTCIAPMVNWSQLCAAQLNRPLQQLQQANYGSSIFAVSAVVRVCCVRALRVLLMRRAGCFVRVCCGVQRDVVCAVVEAAGSDAA